MDHDYSLLTHVPTYGLKPTRANFNPWVSTTLADVGEDTISKHLRNMPLMPNKLKRNSIQPNTDYHGRLASPH